MSEFKEKDIATFLAKTTGLARIGTYEQMKDKLRAAGYGIDMTPAYGVNLILDEALKFYAYEFVDALPLVGVEGFFYILPDGAMVVWDEHHKGYITTGAVIPIDEQLDMDSPNPVMNKVITRALVGKGPFEIQDIKLDSEPLRVKNIPLTAIPSIQYPDEEIIPGGTLLYDASGNLGVVDVYNKGADYVAAKTLVNSETSYLKVDETSTTVGPHELVRAVGATTDVILADLLEYSEVDATWTPINKNDLVKGKTLVFDIRGTLGIFDSFQNSEQYARIRTVTVSDGTQALVKTSGNQLLPFVIGAETSWPVSDLFPSADAIVVGSTLVCDNLGTMAVVTSVNTGATPETMTLKTVSRTLTKNFGRLLSTILNTNIGQDTLDIAGSDIQGLFVPGEYGTGLIPGSLYVYDKFGTVAKLVERIDGSSVTYRATTITNSGANSGIFSYWGSEYFDLKVGARTNLTKIDIENHTNINWSSFQSGKLLIHDQLGTIGIVHQDTTDPTVFYIETINHCYRSGPYRVRNTSLVGKPNMTTEVQDTDINGFEHRFYVPNKTFVFDNLGTVAYLSNYDTNTRKYTAVTYTVGKARTWFRYTGYNERGKWNLTPFVTTTEFGINQIVGIQDNVTLRTSEVTEAGGSATFSAIFVLDHDSNVWAVTGLGTSSGTVRVLCIEVANKPVKFYKVKNTVIFGMNLEDQTTFHGNDIVYRSGVDNYQSAWVKDHTIFYDKNGTLAVLRSCTDEASTAASELTVETISSGAGGNLYRVQGSNSSERFNEIVGQTADIPNLRFWPIDSSAAHLDETNVQLYKTLAVDEWGRLGVVVDCTPSSDPSSDESTMTVMTLLNTREQDLVFKCKVTCPDRFIEVGKTYNVEIGYLENKNENGNPFATVYQPTLKHIIPSRTLICDPEGGLAIVTGLVEDTNREDKSVAHCLCISAPETPFFFIDSTTESDDIENYVRDNDPAAGATFTVYQDYAKWGNSWTIIGGGQYDAKRRFDRDKQGHLVIYDTATSSYYLILSGSEAANWETDTFIAMTLLRLTRPDNAHQTWRFNGHLTEQPGGTTNISFATIPSHYSLLDKNNNQAGPRTIHVDDLVVTPTGTLGTVMTVNNTDINVRTVSHAKMSWITATGVTLGEMVDDIVVLDWSDLNSEDGVNTHDVGIGDLVRDSRGRLGIVSGLNTVDSKATIKTIARTFAVWRSVTQLLPEMQTTTVATDHLMNAETNHDASNGDAHLGDIVIDLTGRIGAISSVASDGVTVNVAGIANNETTWKSATNLNGTLNGTTTVNWSDLSSSRVLHEYPVMGDMIFDSEGKLGTVISSAVAAGQCTVKTIYIGGGPTIWLFNGEIPGSQGLGNSVSKSLCTDLLGRKTYDKIRIGDILIDKNSKTGIVYEFQNSSLVNVKPLSVPMTGATSSADGKGGLVPKPVAGDESKFLRGDGVWQFEHCLQTAANLNVATDTPNGFHAAYATQCPYTSGANDQRVWLTGYTDPTKHFVNQPETSGQLVTIESKWNGGSIWMIQFFYRARPDLGLKMRYGADDGWVYPDNTGEWMNIGEGGAQVWRTTATINATLDGTGTVTNTTLTDPTDAKTYDKAKIGDIVIDPNGKLGQITLISGSTITVKTDLTEMLGATSSADGKGGLVPKPVTGDQLKFLKGDGTWDWEHALDTGLNLAVSTDTPIGWLAAYKTLYPITENHSTRLFFGTYNVANRFTHQPATYGQLYSILYRHESDSDNGVWAIQFFVNQNADDGLKVRYGVGNGWVYPDNSGDFGELGSGGAQVWRTTQSLNATQDGTATVTLSTLTDPTGGKTYTKAKIGDIVIDNQNRLGQITAISGSNATVKTDLTKMTGATSSVDGKGGLAPTPVAGDQNKFLAGDATWKFEHCLQTTKNITPAADTPKGFNDQFALEYPYESGSEDQRIYLTAYLDGSSHFTNQPELMGQMLTIASKWSMGNVWMIQFWYRSGSDAGVKMRYGADNSWRYPGTSGEWMDLGEGGAQIWRTTELLSNTLDATTTLTNSNLTDPTGEKTYDKAKIGDMVIDQHGKIGQITAISGTSLTVKTDISQMLGATSSADGKGGLTPKPLQGDQNKALAGDGTWKEYTRYEDITPGQTAALDLIMQGATASADGLEGFVPKPVAGDNTKYLRGDATWSEIVVPKVVWAGKLGARSDNNNASRVLITNTASVQDSEYITYNNNGTLTVLKSGIYMLHAAIRWRDGIGTSGNEVAFGVLAAESVVTGDSASAVNNWMKFDQTRAMQEKTTIQPITANNIISVPTYSADQSTPMQTSRGEIEVIYLGPINN